MSSIGFRQIGKQSSLASTIRSLAAEYQKFAARQITIDTTDFRTIHRSTQSLLKYNEMNIQSHKTLVTKMFYAPYEPDFRYVVLMLKLDQMGRYSPDSSGFGNRGKIAGSAYMPQKMMDDGIDLGFGENSQYLHFDGMYTFVFVEDAPKLRAKQLNTSMCFTFRLYMMAHSWTPSDPDDDDKPRYIFAKSDDDHQQFGYACAMYPTGKLKFTWSAYGVRYTVETADNVITVKNPGYSDQGYTPTGFDVEALSTLGSDEDMALAVFQIAIICNVSQGYDSNGYDPNGFITGPDNGIQIAVDSAFLTQSATPIITYYSTPSINHLDLFVGNQEDLADDVDDPNANLKVPNYHENYRLRIGAAYPFTGDQQGWYKWHGGIQDFRIYRDRLLTNEDLQYYFANKLSISGYPFGQIAYAGYTMILPTQVGTAGYSVTGFDSTGYDTGF